MIRPSARYAPHLLVTMALFALPIGLRSLAAPRAEPCRDPGAWLAALEASAPAPAPAPPPEPGGGPPAVARKRARWLAEASPEGEWRAGGLPVPGSAAVLRTLGVRSWDPKLLYHLPDARFGTGLRSDGSTRDELATPAGPLPVHATRFGPELAETTLSLHLLAQGGEPVLRPVWAQLRSAPRQLLSGSLPMTLLLVSGRVPARQREAALGAAEAWLARAFADLREACGP